MWVRLSEALAAQDGRSRVIALTPAGRGAVAKGRPLWAKAQQRFARAFGFAPEA